MPQNKTFPLGRHRIKGARWWLGTARPKPAPQEQAQQTTKQKGPNEQ